MERTMQLGNAWPRHRRVEAWVCSQLRSVEHELRVVRTALHLFDLTQHLHGLPPYYRDMLRLAVLTHDVGRAIDDDEHERLGAKLILRDQSLPLPAGLRRFLAFTTWHHRGRIPEPGQERFLRDGDDRASLRQVLALLRAADALDGRTLAASPQLVITLRGRKLVVDCYMDDGAAELKALRKRKKLRMLEEVMGLRVKVEVHDTEGLHLVA